MAPILIGSVALGCSLAPSPGPPDPFGVVRIEPIEDEGEEEEGLLFDPEGMNRNLALRFPGVERVDFVRFLVTPNLPEGPCKTVVSRPWEIGIDLDYEIGGSDRVSGAGAAELKAQGWWPTYRTPQGFGMERRGSFDFIDLTLTTDVRCTCTGRTTAGRSPGRVELRFRWKKGAMPEVSAVLPNEGRRGLTPIITYGHMLSYTFAAGGDYPESYPGRCGADLTVAILGDPPIL